MYYTITVEFKLHSKDMMDDFLNYMKKNAQDSYKNEPGCIRFDVLTPSNTDSEIFLYEIYENKKAFDFHLTTLHLNIFNKNVKSLVANKIVREFDLEFVGSRK